jgi:hypothetical protein
LLKKRLKRAKSESANRLEENQSLMKESHNSCEGDGDGDGDGDGKAGLQIVEESCPTSMQESQDDLPSNHENLPMPSLDEEKGDSTGT